MPLTTLSAGNTVKSAELNGNFALCVLTDTSRTVTVTHTWSASQTFNAGFTGGASADIAINTNKFTVTASTGNTSIAGTLALADTLTYTRNANTNVVGVNVVNTTSGTGATVTYALSNASFGVSLELYSAGYTTSGIHLANSFLIYTNVPNGITLSTDNAAGAIRFYSGSQVLGLTLDASQNLLMADARLQIGGTTASFPAIARTTTAIKVVLADNSAYAGINCAGIGLNGTTIPSNGLQFGTSAPGSLADGQMWYDGTNFKARTAGGTKTVTLA